MTHVEMTHNNAGHQTTSNDPYPVGGFSEPVAMCPIRQPGKLMMSLRFHVGEVAFEIDGTEIKGNIASGMDGSIWIELNDGERYMLNSREMVEAIIALREARRGGEQDGEGDPQGGEVQVHGMQSDLCGAADDVGGDPEAHA